MTQAGCEQLMTLSSYTAAKPDNSLSLRLSGCLAAASSSTGSFLSAASQSRRDSGCTLCTICVVMRHTHRMHNEDWRCFSTARRECVPSLTLSAHAPAALHPSAKSVARSTGPPVCASTCVRQKGRLISEEGGNERSLCLLAQRTAATERSHRLPSHLTGDTHVLCRFSTLRSSQAASAASRLQMSTPNSNAHQRTQAQTHHASPQEAQKTSCSSTAGVQSLPGPLSAQQSLQRAVHRT